MIKELDDFLERKNFLRAKFNQKLTNSYENFKNLLITKKKKELNEKYLNLDKILEKEEGNLKRGGITNKKKCFEREKKFRK